MQQSNASRVLASCAQFKYIAWVIGEHLNYPSLTFASQLTVIQNVYFTFSPFDGECKPSKAAKRMTECEAAVCQEHVEDKACGKHSSKCTCAAYAVAWQWHLQVRKKHSSMGQVNFLLCPSYSQFTDHLQPTPQRMPHAPNKGKIPVKGHRVKVTGEKNLENLNSANRSSRKKEQKLQ